LDEKSLDFLYGIEPGMTKEEYVEQHARYCLTPFAVVKDGKWFERGKMGWWGIVFDERNKDEWSEEFRKLFDDLPPDTLLTLVDCHI